MALCHFEPREVRILREGLRLEAEARHSLDLRTHRWKQRIAYTVLTLVIIGLGAILLWPN